MTVIIAHFRGPWDFLSNFYPAEIVDGSTRYPTSEHAYQSEKTLDPEWRARIIAAPTPAIAKRLGRAAPQRPDWEQVKDAVMDKYVRLKFAQHPDLAQRLSRTWPAVLIEGNDWGDRCWGAEWEGDKWDGDWVGENRLGKLLMKLREELG